MTNKERIFAKEVDTLYRSLPLPLFASWFNALFLGSDFTQLPQYIYFTPLDFCQYSPHDTALWKLFLLSSSF